MAKAAAKRSRKGGAHAPLRDDSHGFGMEHGVAGASRAVINRSEWHSGGGYGHHRSDAHASSVPGGIFATGPYSG